ncbi:hypothetical protein PO909_026414 [Leuciscus waleckii]
MQTSMEIGLGGDITVIKNFTKLGVHMQHMILKKHGHFYGHQARCHFNCYKEKDLFPSCKKTTTYFPVCKTF